MQNKIFENYIYMIVFRVLTVFAPLVTAPYISRVLHTNGVGIYSYSYTIAYMFSLFAALGTLTYGQREIAYRQDDRHKRSLVFWEIISLRAIFTIAILVLYGVLTVFYHEYSIYLMQQVFLIVAVIFDISWFYQGVENFRLVVFRNAIVKIATVVLVFLFVKTENDVGIYILINSLSVLICNIIYFFNLKRYLCAVSISELRPFRHMRGIVEFFIPLISVELYSHLDKIMLGYLTSTTENGYYEQTRKITQLALNFLVSINAVMMPRISNCFAKNEKHMMIQYYQKGFLFLCMLLIPCSVGLYFIADNFVLWFFGAEFAKTSMLLKIACPMLIFMSIGNFVGVLYLSPTGNQNRMTKIYMISAATNIFLNALLIPRLLSGGAMIASVIAEMVSCVLQVWLLKKSEYNFKLTNGIWKYLVATVCMGVALVFCRILPFAGVIKTVIEIVAGGLTYLIVLMLLHEKYILFVINKVLGFVYRFGRPSNRIH